MNHESIIASGLRSIRIQTDSVSGLNQFINEDFVAAVQHINACLGRVVITGIGKSAIIAQKIVATFNSTGTPALFMHAADAIHGDLGMIREEDVVMVISKSGDSPEIKVLLPLLKGFGNKIIGMGGNTASYLAGNCHIYINTTIAQEACPNNLAPTSSTTAQMVMGDALAVCLMELKDFKSADFARYHPGGALGKKLYLRVADILSANKPIVKSDASLKEVIVVITKNRLGAAVVMDDHHQILGIITDGDIRRIAERENAFIELKAKDVMSLNPKSIEADALAAEAFELMRTHHINQLLVTDNGAYAGIIHIQELIREGII